MKIIILPIVAALVVLSLPAAAETPDATEIIKHLVERDKVLVKRRKTFDYDIAITREQLDDKKKVVSKDTDKVVVIGGAGPGYGTRASNGSPDQEQKKAAKEEPFELLKIIDHYDYTLEGQETVDGVLCYKIAFKPKPDQPYDNREEKVLNHVSGHIWCSVADYSLIRNEGSLIEPVSVAWIFASLHEMEFHFDAMLMPNGDYGPGRLQYRYLVSIPFMKMHERDTRVSSDYRPTGTKTTKAK